MADDSDFPPAKSKRRFRTHLTHAGRGGTKALGFVNPPVLRGSTMLYPTIAEREAAKQRPMDRVHGYGINGSATHWALEDMIAGIEGGTRCRIVSTGLAAITVPLLAYLSAGDHCLMPDSIYGPGRKFADSGLTRFGIETTYYDPSVGEAGMAALIRPETRVVYTESPGSATFEVQDIPAIARAAHARGAKVFMDNTWGLHFFQPFQHGVDVSIQALTKYAGGHSDVMLGSITTNDDADFERVHAMVRLLGQYASPDDCWLALRGLRTLGVRLQAQMEAGIEVAHWLRGRPEVAEVLHPALPGAPGHALWKRDFTGASSLFGLVLKPEFSVEACTAMVNAMQLFGIGSSWGGYESLLVPTTDGFTRTASTRHFDGPILRMHVGLEDPTDLIADLEQGFAVLRAYRRGALDE
jgi:cysteine-S-conjugate beta-lyase